MGQDLIQKFIFLILISPIGLSGCSSDALQSPPAPELPRADRFSGDDITYSDLEKAREEFLKTLRRSTDYDTPSFSSEREKYSEKHTQVARAYIVWREKYGTFYEDYDFYRFIFEQVESGLSFPSYEHEHTSAIANAVMKINTDVILFAPAYNKSEFLERIYYIRNGEQAFRIEEFTPDSLRESIRSNPEINQNPTWCVIKNITSKIAIDSNDNATILESGALETINFTQRIYGYADEKEIIFELIAATKIGQKFLPIFLENLKNNEIKIAFEEFSGNPNKKTITAAQWDSDRKKLSLNSKFTWTYGSMAAVLFHEIIHTFPNELTVNVLPPDYGVGPKKIKDLEDEILLYKALLEGDKEQGVDYAEKEKKLKDLKNELMFYDELIAYTYQHEFAQELYRIAPCTLLHLRTKDVQGINDSREVRSRTETKLEK